MELLLQKRYFTSYHWGLSASTHAIRVQYDLSSSPCLFNLSQAITAPTAVGNGKCNNSAYMHNRATITASASGEHRVINNKFKQRWNVVPFQTSEFS
jgi:hypothetical protein